MRCEDKLFLLFFLPVLTSRLRVELPHAIIGQQARPGHAFYKRDKETNSQGGCF